MPTKIKIRPSMRSSWRRCPRAFYQRYIGGVEPARGRKALVVGSAYHAGLEAWRHTGSPSFAAAEAAERYRALCEEANIIGEPQTESQIKAYVLGYAKRFAADDKGVLVVEAKVFDDGDPEGGTADCVMKRPDGRIFLVEDKTTSRLDPEEATRMALLRNDQVTTYIAALRKRGIRVEGVLYRQVLKTQTKITLKETPKTYEIRITDAYQNEADTKYREIFVTWTDAQLAAARSEAHAVSRAIRRAVSRPFEKWPSNPLSCLGPYGACEYLKLCTYGRDDGREFKPTKEEIHDDGSYRKQIWRQVSGPGQSSGPEQPSPRDPLDVF